ncbi:hypothetical protein B0H19DRAFT_1247232 [Mycena capillaripes]|nr:hypothetical protein B0H19DRAFT_1247232 [Mycena capillaripes]
MQKKATELYCELVALAPRHLPALASSLRNLASILWCIGRQEEEPETYFLPALAEALDQLAGYFTEKGDDNNTSALTAESTEKVELIAESDDEEDVEEHWETALKDDKCHDTSDAAINVEEVVSEAVHTIISETPTISTSDTLDSEIAVTARDVGISCVASLEPLSEAQAVVSLVDKIMTSSVTASDERATVQGTVIPAKSLGHLAGILNTPLEVKLNMNVSMSMHSTLVNILWSILVAILFAVVSSHAL